MRIESPRRLLVTAVGAATIGLVAPGPGHAGAVGGPEYGIVSVESGDQLRAAGRTTPVGRDVFDWTDAGIGAAGAATILGVLEGALLLVRRHAPPAHS